MKLKLFTYFFMIMSFSALYTSVPKGSPMLSVFSWNILGPNSQDVADFFNNGKNDYSRVGRAIDRIKSINDGRGASILSLQEVDTKARELLKQQLAPKYIEVSYHAKGNNGGTVLFVKATDFEVLGGKGVDLGDGGAAAIGLVKSKKTGSIFAVSSLHVSRSSYNIGQQQGERQLKQLQDAVEQLEESHNIDPKLVHVMYAGDYNTNNDEVSSSTLEFLNKHDGRSYSEAFAHQDTVNDKNGNRKGIDHIITSSGLQKIDRHSRIIGNEKNKKINEQVESDHAALYAVYIDPQAGVESIIPQSASISKVDLSTEQEKSNLTKEQKEIITQEREEPVPDEVEKLINKLIPDRSNSQSRIDSSFGSDKSLNELEEEYRPLLDYAQQHPDWVRSVSGLKHNLSNLRQIISEKEQAENKILDIIEKAEEASRGWGNSEEGLHDYLLQDQNYKVILNYAEKNEDWKNLYSEIVNQAKIEEVIANIPKFSRKDQNKAEAYIIKNYQVISDYIKKYPDWVKSSSSEEITAEQNISNFVKKFANQEAKQNKVVDQKLAYEKPTDILDKAKNDHAWARKNQDLIEYALYRRKVISNPSWDKEKEQNDLQSYEFRKNDTIFNPYKVLDLAHVQKGFAESHADDIQKANNRIIDKAEKARAIAQTKYEEHQAYDQNDEQRVLDDRDFYGI